MRGFDDDKEVGFPVGDSVRGIVGDPIGSRVGLVVSGILVRSC